MQIHCPNCNEQNLNIQMGDFESNIFCLEPSCSFIAEYGVPNAETELIITMMQEIAKLKYTDSIDISKEYVDKVD